MAWSALKGVKTSSLSGEKRRHSPSSMNFSAYPSRPFVVLPPNIFPFVDLIRIRAACTSPLAFRNLARSKPCFDPAYLSSTLVASLMLLSRNLIQKLKDKICESWNPFSKMGFLIVIAYICQAISLFMFFMFWITYSLESSIYLLRRPLMSPIFPLTSWRIEIVLDLILDSTEAMTQVGSNG